jgi:Flp pilus assembly CpaF family ATPase
VNRHKYNFQEIVPKVQNYCVEREVSVPRWRKDVTQEALVAFNANMLRAMRALDVKVAEEDRQELAEELAIRIRGVGVLHPFLQEEGVEEIIVRGGFVQTERKGQIFDEGALASDEYFYRLARRVADMEGEELSGEKPQVKVGLPDGSRFTATIPPISRNGTAINIRRFSLKRFTFDDLIDAGSTDEETVELLKEVAASMKISVAFSGRPGSGKTTWLNAFSRYLPQRAQLSCIESFQELQMQVPHPHHLVVEEDPDLMGQAINTTILRMRPDVLVIGEIVAKEALEYVMALNLGIVTHTTVHSNSARLTLTRLESLSRGSDIPLSERKGILGSCLGLIVHLSKDYDRETGRYERTMEELLAVRGTRDGDYVTEVLKERDGDGFTPLRAGTEIWQAR